MSVLLAIDTASRYASVALYREDGLLAEQSWRSRNNQSVEVLPAIERLLAMTGCQRGDLAAVAVAGGPGSFTGLRIGMSLAKGLCLTLGIPIIAVPTLEITAYGAGDTGGPVIAVIEAGRQRLHVGTYSFVDGLPRLQGEVSLQSVDQWAPELSEPVFITGEITPALAERLLALPGSEAIALASPAGSARRAGYLAELAWYRWQADDTDDLDALGPLYQQQPLSGAG
jgi:tRNA threonylcarbamoyladenosine biosynthesis protein TsaB